MMTDKKHYHIRKFEISFSSKQEKKRLLEGTEKGLRQ